MLALRDQRIDVGSEGLVSDSVESRLDYQIRAAVHERTVKASALSEEYLRNMQALDQAYDQTIKALREQARQQGIDEARWQVLLRQATVPPRL